MTRDEILQAAEYIILSEKIENFMREMPTKPSSVTITFRKNSTSRSLTLKDKVVVTKVYEALEDTQLDIKEFLSC